MMEEIDFSDNSLMEFCGDQGEEDRDNDDDKIKSDSDAEIEEMLMSSEEQDEDKLADKTEEEDDSSKLSKHSDVFASYAPKFVPIGSPHIQPLCEGSGLSCVTPPAITYELKMDESFYTENEDTPARLSSAQLEAIYYACQSHEVQFEDDKGAIIRQGFLLGDGTGTGKSRTLAGILLEYTIPPITAGRKHIWVTVKSDLFSSAESEMKHFVPNIRFVKIKTLEKEGLEEPQVPTVLMLTYSELSTKIKKQKELIKKWCGKFEGVMIFDEAHAAKNAYDTGNFSDAGQAVVSLQEEHPNARVVYSTATGASEPHHMLYMSRLQLWGPKTNYASGDDLKAKLKRRGVAAIELLAIEMKMRGVFISRQISFEKVKVEEIAIELEGPNSQESFEPIYDMSCQIWELILIHLNRLREAKAKDIGKGGSNKVAAWTGYFYAASLEFFKSLIVSSKISETDFCAREFLKKSCSIIIGMQMTGDSQFKNFTPRNWCKGQPYSNVLEILRGVLAALGVAVGCPRAYFKDGTSQKLGNWTEEEDRIASVRETKWDILNKTENPANAEESKKPGTSSKKSRPYKYCFEEWPLYSVGSFLSIDDGSPLESPINLSWSYEEVKSNITSEGLAKMFHELALFLPINPLDEIINRLQNGSPCRPAKYSVAELTGRSFQYLYDVGNEKWVYIKKDIRQMQKERDAFMNLEKRVCVISSAASTGFSLHSDKSRKNKQKRIHITIQFPYSPDELFQQLGRSHRTNQDRFPKYILIKSPVPAEVRFITVIAKRMKQLGAFCSGHSQANPLGDAISDCLVSRLGLLSINAAIAEMERTSSVRCLMTTLGVVKISGENSPVFVASKSDDISRVLNRVLMMPLNLQETFFSQVSKHYDKLSATDPSVYLPIMEFPATEADVSLVWTRQMQFDSHLYRFTISRTISWEAITVIKHQLEDAGTPGDVYVRKSDKSEIMFAYRDEDGKIYAYFPYNRVKKEIPSNYLRMWRKSNGANRDHDYAWFRRIQLINQYPGCSHAVEKRGRCKINPNCKFQWGVYDLLLLCGRTSEYLDWLEIKFPEHQKQLKIGKIKYVEGGEQKAVVGLLIDVYGKKDIESELLDEYGRK